MIFKVGVPGASNNCLTPLDKIPGDDRARFRQMFPYKNNFVISFHQGGIILNNHPAHPEGVAAG
jgi:hypothetical protein